MTTIELSVLYLDESDIIPKYLRTVQTIKDNHILVNSLKMDARNAVKVHSIVIYRDIKGKLLAYSNYISGSKPYFDVKEQKNGNWSGFQTLITPQGREAFRLLLQVKENN